MALFYIGLLVLLAIFFLAILLYGTREKSFEQALEEQRNKSNYDLLLNSGKSSDQVSNKKQENKKEKSKKVKDTGVSKKTSSKDTRPTVVAAPVNAPVVSKFVSAPKEPSVTKPIVTVSSAAVKDAAETRAVFAKGESVASSQSSDVVDQIEIVPVKAPQLESIAPAKLSQVTDVPQNTNKSAKSQNVRERETVVETKQTVPVAKVVSEQFSQQQQPTPQPSKPTVTKKSKRSIPKASPELSFEDILELVNSSYFSADDITRLTDALLNRQAEEQNTDYNWHKKNDPLEALQKQLAEKEKLLDQQTKNIETAKKKSEGLLNDLNNLRKRCNKVEIDNDNLRKQVESQKSANLAQLHEIEARSQQKLEQRINDARLEERNRVADEVNALQAKLAKSNSIIASQSEDVKNKQSSLEELTQLKQHLEDKNRDLSAQLDDNRERYDKLQRQLSAADDGHGQAITKLQAEIVELKQANAKLELAVQASDALSSADIEGFNAQINGLKAELDSKICANAELDKLVAELKSKLSSASAAESSVAEDFEHVKAKLADLEGHNGSLSSQLSNVTSEKNSLLSKLNESNSLIKTHVEEIENLRSVCRKLGLSIDGDNVQSNIDSVKAKISHYDELNSKTSDLSELYEQISAQNEALKSQVETLKQQNRDEIQKASEYATTLQETEKILNDLQEKIIKNKSEQNQKLEHFEHILSTKNDEIESIKDEANKYRENVENLNKINENLSDQINDLKELVTAKDAELSQVDFQNEIAKIQAENKSLNAKIVKLNHLIQIANDSFQEENQKVQDLESKISLMNGKENGNNSKDNVPTSNGTSST